EAAPRPPALRPRRRFRTFLAAMWRRLRLALGGFAAMLAIAALTIFGLTAGLVAGDLRDDPQRAGRRQPRPSVADLRTGRRDAADRGRRGGDPGADRGRGRGGCQRAPGTGLRQSGRADVRPRR